MKTFINNLFSRKFLLCLGTAMVMIASKQYDQALIVALGYCGINVAESKVLK